MKEIPTTIYSPSVPSGRFSVVIFSHGLFGDCNGYAILGKTLASYGYICIHPTHRDRYDIYFFLLFFYLLHRTHAALFVVLQ